MFVNFYCFKLVMFTQAFYLIFLSSFFWFINSTIENVFFISFGVVSVAIVSVVYFFLVKQVKKEFHDDVHVFKMIPNIFIVIKSILNLIGEIFISTLDLSWKIISNKKLDSCIISMSHKNVESDFKLMLLSHSITMTPGSITIHQTNRRFYIHLIDKSLLKDFEEISNDIKFIDEKC
jgi:multisubunit Na+/H+ antiporter MnhE subunit